jgi:thioredoxin-like negative regulator of GroEL
MDSEGATQYERLTHAMADVHERSRQIIAEARKAAQPQLLFVYSETSGRSRRADAFLAQVLQRRHNHDTFDVIRVCAEQYPELVAQLGVTQLPALLVLEQRKIETHVENPRGPQQIHAALQRWLK